MTIGNDVGGITGFEHFDTLDEQQVLKLCRFRCFLFPPNRAT